MHLFTRYAPAKLNLFLHIKERLSNGYHSILSFIIFIDLYDIITIRNNDTLCLNIKGNTGRLLQQSTSIEDNILIKVVKYIQQKFNINKNLYINLEKNIPIGAGLGGGSSDAATVLKLLNNYWKLNIKDKDLANIALKFGADVPSCFYSKSGMIENIGEKFTSIPIKFKLPILLINNLKPLNTKQVYLNNKIFNNKSINFSLSISDNKKNFLNFLKQQTNDLTESAICLSPEIKLILNKLEETCPILSRMTGSGSTCFAIYSSQENLTKAANKISQYFPNFLIKKVTNLISENNNLQQLIYRN